MNPFYASPLPHDVRAVVDEPQRKPLLLRLEQLHGRPLPPGVELLTLADTLGVAALLSWAPGEADDGWVQGLGGAQLPAVEKHSRAVVLAHCSAAELPPLMQAAVGRAAGDAQAEVVLTSCAAAELLSYKALGFSSFGGAVTARDRLPLALLTADQEHLRRVDSPLSLVLLDLIDQGVPLRGVPEALLRALGRGPMERAVGTLQRRVPFLQRLSPEVRQALNQAESMLELTPGQALVRKGELSQDLYVVLEGALQVHDGDRHITLLVPGDLLGEVAFFRASGARSADVSAATAARVLCLRHDTLERLRSERPHLAIELLQAVGAALADCLVERTRQTR